MRIQLSRFVGGDKGEGASSIQYLPLPGENGDDGDGTWRTAIWSFLKKTPIKLGDVSCFSSEAETIPKQSSRAQVIQQTNRDPFSAVSKPILQMCRSDSLFLSRTRFSIGQ